ncbi:DNA ligase/mRNA capping enzyme [Roridomyces roridus]|uniref:DNA ligase/mRNA capping enzyme n=1 Tax=Roridomyces roridus TaxID=1738132 RepID=A0AAD7BI09_9AGAR|nr:DNA ligase/mRNA capping enzyme [Roridomyces roridus]
MSDELAEIDGEKPKVLLADGEDREVQSMSSNSTYKVKRTFDHYYCTCPGGVPVNGRSCKHLIDLLGYEYEAARVKWKNPDGKPLAAPGKKKAAPNAKKPASKAKSKKKDDDEEEDEDEEDAKPKKKAKPASKARSKRKADDDDEDEDEDDEDVKAKKKKAKPASKAKSKKKADDDDDEEDEEEEEDVKPKSKSKPASKAGGKRKRDDDDEDEDEDEKPKKKKPASKSKGKKKADEDEEEDEDGGSGGAPDLLLANKWEVDKGPDPTGWWISEKLDGVRTYYDGKTMISRLGNPFTPPQWFLDKLPKDVTLDGELFAGRGKFQDTISIVKTINSPHWKEITFQIFDIPSEDAVFEKRVEKLQKLFGPGGTYECPEVVLVEHEKAKDRQHVLDKLEEIEGLGGEGLMLRRAGSKYEGKRSGTLLKVKTFYDAEAEVTGYTDGKGKHVGVVGALMCKMESGKKFNVGTGLSDKQRKNPPKVGSIIVYRFQELTRDGVPRFPSFVGEAVDKKKAKDAEVPDHRKGVTNKD